MHFFYKAARFFLAPLAGLETPTETELLRDLGCDILRGECLLATALLRQFHQRSHWNGDGGWHHDRRLPIAPALPPRLRREGGGKMRRPSPTTDGNSIS
ncbi:hypothetical protein ACC689_33025 [Rhizobium ruizarguesonis]